MGTQTNQKLQHLARSQRFIRCLGRKTQKRKQKCTKISDTKIHHENDTKKNPSRPAKLKCHSLDMHVAALRASESHDYDDCETHCFRCQHARPYVVRITGREDANGNMHGTLTPMFTFASRVVAPDFFHGTNRKIMTPGGWDQWNPMTPDGEKCKLMPVSEVVAEVEAISYEEARRKDKETPTQNKNDTDDSHLPTAIETDPHYMQRQTAHAQKEAHDARHPLITSIDKNTKYKKSHQQFLQARRTNRTRNGRTPLRIHRKVGDSHKDGRSRNYNCKGAVGPFRSEEVAGARGEQAQQTPSSSDSISKSSHGRTRRCYKSTSITRRSKSKTHNRLRPSRRAPNQNGQIAGKEFGVTKKTRRKQTTTNTSCTKREDTRRTNISRIPENGVGSIHGNCHGRARLSNCNRLLQKPRERPSSEVSAEGIQRVLTSLDGRTSKKNQVQRLHSEKDVNMDQSRRRREESQALQSRKSFLIRNTTDATTITVATTQFAEHSDKQSTSNSPGPHIIGQTRPTSTNYQCTGITRRCTTGQQQQQNTNNVLALAQEVSANIAETHGTQGSNAGEEPSPNNTEQVQTVDAMGKNARPQYQR